MKTFVAVFCFGAWLGGASAQGLINFVNTPSTLVRFDDGTGNSPPYFINRPGMLYFGLLTSPVGANTFTFAGVYATNQSVLGQFTGGVGVPVPGWTPGTARDFEVIGWDPNLGGAAFNPAWLTDTGSVGETIYWNFSGIGTGVAGGITSSGTLPSLDLFGGTTGIQQGFTVYISHLVPEPSSVALVALGGVSFLILRGRKAPN